MAIFGPKAWVNLFGKMSIFRLFELLIFIAYIGLFFVLEYPKYPFYSLERRFFVLAYCKRHFPGLYYLKKLVGKMVIFRPKQWVNPFGKMSIFRFFELIIFIAYKGVFSFYNIVKDIFLAYIA